MSISNISGLHFQPWVGKEYDTKGRLLLLGESHYLDDEPNEEDDFSIGYGDMTIEVIRDGHLAGKDMRTPFFRNIGFLFYPDDCFKIWNEVAFANAIQIGLPKAKSQPGTREIETIAPAFQLLLDGLKPEKVMVLSKRMWFQNWIPEDRGQFVSHIVENGKRSTVWQYEYVGGRCLAVAIAHPSRMRGNSYNKWKPLVDNFLSMPLSKG